MKLFGSLTKAGDLQVGYFCVLILISVFLSTFFSLKIKQLLCSRPGRVKNDTAHLSVFLSTFGSGEGPP